MIKKKKGTVSQHPLDGMHNIWPLMSQGFLLPELVISRGHLG
jgi:hypothetical protein